jgi:hypothetical protein
MPMVMGVPDAAVLAAEFAAAPGAELAGAGEPQAATAATVATAAMAGMAGSLRWRGRRGLLMR